MLIYSTRTCAQIQSGNYWQNLENPINKGSIGGRDIESVRANNLSVTSSGALLILDGLIYNSHGMHVTITPDSMGEWTYLHATQVGGDGKSAYFALAYDDFNQQVIVQTTNYTDIDYKKVDVSKKQYFWKNVPADLVNDIGVIIAALVNGNYQEGEAV